MKLASIDRISVLNIHYINYSLDYFLDCQQALGVKNVELLAGRQDMWLDHKGSIDPKIIKNKLDDRGLICPVITPDNCMLGYQFAAKEPELRERSYNYFVNGIRLGAELGAKILEANSGWGYWNEPEEKCTSGCPRWRRNMACRSPASRCGRRSHASVIGSIRSSICLTR